MEFIEFFSYIINYKQIGNLWYYDYAMIDIRFNAHRKISLFKTNYSIVSELAVTNRSDNEKEINSDNRIRFADQLSKKVSAFTDNEFWEDYNIIEPTESLNNAIDKLLKKHGKMRNEDDVYVYELNLQ